MPNGEDKNWIRLCGAVDGFRARYGSWPTKIKIPFEIIDDIRGVFGDEMFEKVVTRVKFEAIDYIAFIAEDDHGRQYNYVQEGFSKISPDIQAMNWFEIE